MADWSGESKGLPLGYQIFVFILKKFGLFPAYVLLYFVAFYYFLTLKESNKNIRYLYKERLGFGIWKSLYLNYKNYHFLGQSIIDKVVVMAGLSDQLSHTSLGNENIAILKEQKRGGVILGAHLGNWEIAGKFLFQKGNAVNVVMYEGENAAIKNYMETVTGNRKYNVITIKNDLSHVYAMGEALERAELICMHGDRFLEGSRFIELPFLGQKAKFPIGPFQLIKSFKAPYTFVYGIKTSLSHYQFYATPLREVTADDSIETIAQNYVNELEQKVKEFPEQWFNYHDFWK